MEDDYNEGVETQFVWKESWHSHDSSWFECQLCKTKYCLPNDPVKRKALAKWQAKGCPLPVWFRPTQVAVLLTLLTLCFWQPLYMFLGYCALSYAIMGYELLSGHLVGPHNAGWTWYLSSWLLSPLHFAIYFIICAIRPPIL
jgi:hypothetical protein